jgi:hypothetical protein
MEEPFRLNMVDDEIRIRIQGSSDPRELRAQLIKHPGAFMPRQKREKTLWARLFRLKAVRLMDQVV